MYLPLEIGGLIIRVDNMDNCEVVIRIEEGCKWTEKFLRRS